MIKNYKLRKCISKFRPSSHQLEIERGRHHKPKLPEEDRLCRFCQTTCIESEEHFLLHCTLYSDDRIQLFTHILNCEPELLDGTVENVFVSIMSSDNERVLFGLAKFIQICMKKREDSILI